MGQRVTTSNWEPIEIVTKASSKLCKVLLSSLRAVFSTIPCHAPSFLPEMVVVSNNAGLRPSVAVCARHGLPFWEEIVGAES
jgi:hypothetical protein